jgi:hypothetical protein
MDPRREVLIVAIVSSLLAVVGFMALVHLRLL